MRIARSRKTKEENPPEIQGREEDYRPPEDAKSTQTYHSPTTPGSTKMVFYGDHQYNVTVRRGPIQSRIFDKKIGVSVRPQAVTLATGVIQRELESRIEDPQGEFAGYYEYNMGDVLDVSNIPEWALFLNASDETVDFADALAEYETLDWSDVDSWTRLYLQALYQTSRENLPPIIEGNHDGAYVGNGLNHVVDPTDLRLKIIRFKAKEKKLEYRITALDDKISSTRSPTKKAALQEDRAELVSLYEKTVAKRMELERILEDYKSAKHEVPQDEQLVPGWLENLILNAIFAIPRGRTLFDPNGYAAQNSGGAGNIVDKKKFIHLYLQARYKDLEINSDSLAPLATQLDYFDETNGDYRTNKSHFSNLDSKSPSDIKNNFNNFWTELRPGEFTCLFSYPDREHASTNKKYILLQAIDQGVDANGIRQFHFLLDGMDATEQNIPTAFYGVMSTWQRRLCQIFVDYQRLNNPQGCLFYHSSHFPLRDLAKKQWKESGWLAYFQQNDVAPFIFAGHRHARAIIDASRSEFLGFQFPFSKPSIKKDKAYSIVTPSQTDNMEFMSAETLYDPDGQKMELTIRYHEIIPSDEREIARRFDADVITAVNSLKPHYEQNRYRHASTLKDGFFSSVYHVFFTDQEDIVAFDTIPLSIYQFNETLVYTQKYLEFLALDLGAESPFTVLVQQVYDALVKHLQIWLYGNPESDDVWDRKGYLATLAEANCKKRRSDAAAALIHYNDIFDTPTMELLRHLIGETPKSNEHHKAYDFWLLLARRAQDEETRIISKRERKKAAKNHIPEEVTLEFDMSL